MNDMNRRKGELKNFLIECCKSSSIYYDGRWPSIKYLCGKGTVLFVERSRKLDYVELPVPNYQKSDDVLIGQIMSSRNDGVLIGCESHSYGDCHYCYTFSLRENDY